MNNKRITLRRPVVWMNVTTSVGWNRPPVGIVRVERALAENLHKLFGTDQLKFCIWEDGEFVEWKESPVHQSFNLVEQATDVIMPRHALFDLAQPFLSKGRRQHRTSSALATELQSSTQPPSQPKKEKPHPTRGDFLISVGLDWDNQYTDRFYEISKKQGIRIITCCYDLIPVLFPQYCVGEVAQRFTEYFLQLSWGSEAVLCISEQTRTDYLRLCRSLGAPTRETIVIPLGDSVPNENEDVGHQVHLLSQHAFILFVSTIERRKNHEVLYRAYHTLARRGYASILPKLVFVGMPGWGIGDLMKDIELDPLTKGLIVQLNHVTDSELSHLYKHAAFCVYPSLYEGWGLPVGEALAMGKAVLSSSEGSLPEVGGDLVRYVPAWDVYAWSDALLEMIQNPSLIADLEQTVRKGYKARQWSQTARVVKQLVDELSSKDTNTLHIVPGYELSTYSGTHVGHSILSNGVAGLLLFGPHWALANGTYIVKIYGRANRTNDCDATIEFVSGAGKTVHYAQSVNFSQQQNMALQVAAKLSLAKGVDDFEIRCVVGDGAYIQIDHIEIVTSIDSPQETMNTEMAMKAA